MKEPIIFLSIEISFILSFLFIIKIIIWRKEGYFNRKAIFRRIDRVLLIFSFIAILVSLLFDFNYLQYKSPIPFKDWKTITIADFRGLKKPNSTLDGMSDFAFITSSIDIQRKSNSIIIVALFHPARSYVYNRNIYSKGLLTHEMYHFHITEYFARLMRKDLTDCIKNEKPYDLDAIEKKYLQREREMQFQYDDETYHSYVLEKQIDWQQKIDSLLIGLKGYSETQIYFKK